MGRLYAVEALMTLTGANADHRLRIAASSIPAVAARLAQEILGKTGQSGEIVNKLQAAAGSVSAQEKWIVKCAEDLLANKGKCLVLAGHRQPLAVHLLANAINAALGNVGGTLILREAPESKPGAIAGFLAQALAGGRVVTLVVLGGYAVYNAPAVLNWAAAQVKGAKAVVRLGYYEDESLPKNGWSLPLAHFLESWGDARTSDGTLVSIQPLIEPLFEGMTEIEVVARIAGCDKTNPYDIVRDTFRSIGKEGDEDWKKYLHDGFLPDSAPKPVSAQLSASAIEAVLASAGLTPAGLPSKEKLEVVFHRDYKMDDGRFNNNGWMQELPDPITKMTWENVILMSPQTATDLGLLVVNRENNRTSKRLGEDRFLDGRSI